MPHRNINGFQPSLAAQHHSRNLEASTHNTNTKTKEIVQGDIPPMRLTQTSIQLKSPTHKNFTHMIDINKALGTIPKHILQQKIWNTTFHTKDKKWLTNFLPIEHKQYVKTLNPQPSH